MRGILQESGVSWENSQQIPPEHSTIVKSLIADHLLCNVTIQTLNGNLFFVCTMIDSGSQLSLISEKFVSRHHLTSIPLRPAIPIQGLDGCPLAKGSISHIASIKVKISDHSELKSFGIVNMPWDLLLGVDWLHTHNLEIDWKSSSIHFSCCDSGHSGTRSTSLAPGALHPAPCCLPLLPLFRALPALLLQLTLLSHHEKQLSPKYLQNTMTSWTFSLIRRPPNCRHTALMISRLSLNKGRIPHLDLSTP